LGGLRVLLRRRLLRLSLLGPLRLLGGLSVLLRRRLLLLSLLGTLRLLGGLSVLLRLRWLLLSRLGPLLLLRRLALLLFSRLCRAFLRSLLPRVQRSSRPDNQKQGRGAGRSNKLHCLVSIKVAVK
jgi:hypothetical protein